MGAAYGRHRATAAKRGKFHVDKPKNTVSARNVLLAIVFSILGTSVALWRTFWAPAPPKPYICSLPVQKLTKGYILHNVTIVDPPHLTLQRKSIFIRHGLIVDIVDSDDVSSLLSQLTNVTVLGQYPFRSCCRRQLISLLLPLNYAGVTVTPGFIDLHAQLPPNNFLHLPKYFSLLYLYHGVTTTRVTADLDGTASGVVQALIKRLFLSGPRILECVRARWFPANVDGADFTTRFVEKVIKDGSKCIIIDKNLTLDQFKHYRTAAEPHKIALVGRVPQGAKYEDGLLSEVQGFEGIVGESSKFADLSALELWDSMDESRIDEIVRISRELQISNTPMLNSHRVIKNYENCEHSTSNVGSAIHSLLPEFYRKTLWHPQGGISAVRNLSEATLQHLDQSLNQRVSLTRQLLAADLPVFIGSDPLTPFYVPGFSLHQEARLFRQILSLSDEKIIELLTKKAAEHLGEAKLGQISVGAPADILIWNKLPDFSTPIEQVDMQYGLSRSIPDAVIKDGCLFPRAAFENRLSVWHDHFDQRIWKLASSIYARFVLRRNLDFWV